MKLDRSKVYGYSNEYLLEHGEPAENRTNIRADFDDVLTVKEIEGLFPNQWLIIEQVDHNGYPEDGDFKTARVRYYKCDSSNSWQLIDKLMQEEPKKRRLFMETTTWQDDVVDVPYMG